MKKSLLLITVLFSITLFAQNSGGPGPYGYTWVNNDASTGLGTTGNTNVSSFTTQKRNWSTTRIKNVSNQD